MLARPIEPGSAALPDADMTRPPGAGPGAGRDPEPALSARRVVVRYGPRTAVAGVDLDIRRGEVLGLLGPNGAGKTTLLRRLAGLVSGAEGAVLDPAGRDPAADPSVRAAIGYLPEDPPLYPDDTARSYVTYLAALSGMRRGERRAAAEEALRRTGAADLTDRLLGRLSKGQRQRVALAGAIVHRPAVLLLDEPSDGLDPRQLVSFRKLLGELSRSSAVIFSTHLLAEVQSVCDRAVVIDGGRVVLDRRLGRSASEDAVRLRVEVIGAEAGAARAVVLAVPGVRAFDHGVAEVDSPDAAEAIAAAIVRAGWRLRHLAPAPDDLEAAFLDAVTGATGEAATNSRRSDRCSAGGARR